MGLKSFFHLQSKFLANILFSFFAIALNFWFKTFLSTVFSKTDLGIYYSLLDIVSAGLLIFVGARSSMIVHFAKTSNDILILNLFRMALISMTILISIFLILTNHFWAAISSLLLIIFVASQAVYIYFFNQLGMYKLYNLTNVITFIEPIMLIGLFFSTAFFFNYSFEQLLLSTILEMLLLAFLIFSTKNISEPALSYTIYTAESKQFIKDTLLASLEFLVGILGIYLCVLFFASYYGLALLGEFQVVAKSIYFYFLTLFVFPIFKFVFPELSTLIVNKNKLKISKITRFILLYTLMVVVLLYLLIFNYGERFILSSFGDTYNNAIWMIKILFIAFASLILNGYFGSFLKGCGLFRTTLILRALGLAIFVILFFILEFIEPTYKNILISFAIGHISTTVIFATLYTKELAKIESDQPLS